MNTSSRINRFKFSPAFSYTRSSYGESAGSKSISALSTCKKEYGFPLQPLLLLHYLIRHMVKLQLVLLFFYWTNGPKRSDFCHIPLSLHNHSNGYNTCNFAYIFHNVLFYYIINSVININHRVRPRMFTTINHIRNIYMMFC